MLIYICQDGLQPSGVATYGYHFLKNYPKAQMVLLNASRPPPAAPRSLHKRIHLIDENDSHSVSILKDYLKKITANAHGEITLLPNTGDTPWAAVAAFFKEATPSLRARVRILGIIHSDMESQYSLADFYLPIAPLWIGVSGRCAQIVAQRIGKRKGVAHKLFCPVEIPKKLNRRNNKALQISYVGRLEEPQKKVSRLAPLFQALVQQKVNFHAVIAGDGPAAADTKAAFKKAGREILSRIKIAGALEHKEIKKLWQKTDIFILTSAYEGLPLALLEAMAHGCCPVVMSVKSGLPEILKDRKNARIVAQGNVKAMAAAIQELDKNRKLMKKLSQQARADIVRQFSTGTHFKQLDKIIARLRKMPPGDAHALEAEPTEKAVAKLVKKIKSFGKPAVIYGTGMFGRKVLDACLEQGIKVAALVDSNPAKHGKIYRSVACRSVADIPRFAHAVFAVGSLAFSGEIAKRIDESCAAAKITTPPIVCVSL